MIEAVELHVSYPTHHALRGASIRVPYNSSVAVVGASGSGKSTLLHCLGGLHPPDSGEVRFGNTRYDRLADRKLSALRRARFGFVFQFAELVPELSLLENVALPLRFGGAQRRSAEATALSMLSELNIDDLADRKPAQVSGGQLQRAAIARALVHRPDVVFADEPTGALDQETGVDVLRTLFDRTTHAGASLVLVTHDLDVASLADRVVSMVDGICHEVR